MMKRSLTVAMGAVVVGCWSSLACAGSIGVKSLELDAGLTFQHTSVSIDGGGDFGVTIFDIDGSLGYFVTPHIEAVGGLLINHESFDDFSTTGFGLKASGFYNFTTSGSTVPFAGIGLGFVNYSGDGPSNMEVIFPEISGGIRFPFRDVASLNITGGYRHRFTAYGVNDAGGNDIFLGFGFSLFLRGGFGG